LLRRTKAVWNWSARMRPEVTSRYFCRELVLRVRVRINRVFMSESLHFHQEDVKVCDKLRKIS
jgi:hypothetical protein